MTFADLFRKVTGHEPYMYQVRLASLDTMPDVLVAPTGAGKSAALLLLWFWRSLYADDATRMQTPKRLVYCLPQRTLVEQIANEAKRLLFEIQRVAAFGDLNFNEEINKISVHVLQGGEVDNSWESYPDQRAILVGTQDQLLSRALNRGYGMSKYKVSVHMALLNVDALWICDEVQLMDVGVKTSAQLQAFRVMERDKIAGVTHTIWTSATFHPSLIDTIDFRKTHPNLNIFSLSDEEKKEERLGKILDAAKTIVPSVCKLTKESSKKGAQSYIQCLVDQIQNQHESGKLTLVILNRVQRAQDVFKEIKVRQIANEVLLVHSRFRSVERMKHRELLDDIENRDCILIATQAIEAGVDLSAQHLITELASWSSLVQRFGRCNRRGHSNNASVTIVDIEDDKELALPYTVDELTHSKKQLFALRDVGPSRLPEIVKTNVGGLVLRYRDLKDLFDTSADLSGADIDVSRYIRDNRDVDVQVYWRKFVAGSPDPVMRYSNHEEICSISLGVFRDYLKKRNKVCSRTAWVWDGMSHEFMIVRDSDLYPGQTLLLDTTCGGYSTEEGFSPDCWNEVEETKPRDLKIPESNKPDLSILDDPDSRTSYEVTLAQHLDDVYREAKNLVSLIRDDSLKKAILRAAYFHDVGKSLRFFQVKLGNSHYPEQLLAKSKDSLYGELGIKSTLNELEKERIGFRHELASALAVSEYAKINKNLEQDLSLVMYLIVAHHGKVRASIRSLPIEPEPKKSELKDQSLLLFARGVRHGDTLPQIKLLDGTVLPEVSLDLRPMLMGFSENERVSWVAMVQTLVDTYGVFQLAWLEMLVRVADWRASAKEVKQ